MFLHAVGFGIVTAAVMAPAAVVFTVQSGVTRRSASSSTLSGAADPATWRGAFSRTLDGLA